MRPPFHFQPSLASRRKMTERDRILASLRRVDLGPLEQARANTARGIQGLIPRILQELRIDRRQSETEIIKVWNELIDPTITAHAQPTGINKGTLFVTVDSSAWLDEIVRYRRREILDRLQHCFGRDLVARISFRTG